MTIVILIEHIDRDVPGKAATCSVETGLGVVRRQFCTGSLSAWERLISQDSKSDRI
jgi:hypothetical protein